MVGKKKQKGIEFNQYGLSRLSTLEKVLGISGNSIQNLVAMGKFPKPVKTGLTCVLFKNSDVIKWVQDLDYYN